MLDRQHPALYNQAIMDFGALQCKPTSPLCDTCPLAETCQALQEHLVDKLPIKAKRTAIRDRYFTYIYTRTEDGKTLLQRRGSGDIWQGLFEFPMTESACKLKSKQVEEFIHSSILKDEVNIKVELIAQDVLHQLTHQRLHTDFYCLTLLSAETQMKGQWIEEKSLDRYALPRLLEKLLEKLKN